MFIAAFEKVALKMIKPPAALKPHTTPKFSKALKVQEPMKPATLRGQNGLTGSPEMEAFGKPMRRFGALRQKSFSLVSRTAALGGRR